MTAKETDLAVSDVPEEEVFLLSDFKEFHVKLRNWQGNVVKFEDLVKSRKVES